jgi:hypothetical protein
MVMTRLREEFEQAGKSDRFGDLSALLFQEPPPGEYARLAAQWKVTESAVRSSVFDVGVMDGCPCFSMEFFPGGSLAQRLARQPMPIEESVRLLVKIARGVFFAHQHGVLHRDLKPANILLDAEGEPHVADFGLAKELDSDSDHTRNGTVLGSPNYMSPEQVAGKVESLTVATDIYGLGAILYELLTRRAPFLASTPLETMRLVVEQDAPRPSTVTRSTDRDLETICLKCLDKEPSRRYATAGDLAADLERWLGHEPIHARPIAGWERFRKWVRRRPALASLSALLGATLLAGLAGVCGNGVKRKTRGVMKPFSCVAPRPPWPVPPSLWRKRTCAKATAPPCRQRSRPSRRTSATPPSWRRAVPHRGDAAGRPHGPAMLGRRLRTRLPNVDGWQRRHHQCLTPSTLGRTDRRLAGEAGLGNEQRPALARHARPQCASQRRVLGFPRRPVRPRKQWQQR